MEYTNSRRLSITRKNQGGVHGYPWEGKKNRFQQWPRGGNRRDKVGKGCRERVVRKTTGTKEAIFGKVET